MPSRAGPQEQSASLEGARWAGGPFGDEVDDAVQDAFVECLRGDGALAKADPDKPGRFRTFLYAVVRNVALRHEERAAKEHARREGDGVPADDLSADDPRLSQVFDRAWADAILKRAAAGQRAAHRAAERALPLLQPGKSLRFAYLPTGQDPDSLIQSEGAAAMGRVIEGAKPLAEMVWDMETQARAVDTPERRADLEIRLRQRIGQIADGTVRQYYQDMLRERLWNAFRRAAKPVELIISKARTKNAVKKCNVSSDFYGALDKMVRESIKEAEARAIGNKRKTLKPVDL